MKTPLSLIVLSMILPFWLYSQDVPRTKPRTIKSIHDIPHKTPFEKFMWVHRCIAFQVTKPKSLKYDTAYIRSYKRRFVVTLPVSNRFLNFNLVDMGNGNKLQFIPNRIYTLGISISSRWASFVYNSRIKIYEENGDLKGKTNYRDYQLNLYNRKFTADMFVQYYQGFYIKNSKAFEHYTGTAPYQVRSDVYAIHIGASSYYVFNNKRFSFGNSFAFFEQQKKSAGSFLAGIYYSYFTATGDPSLVSEPFRTSFDSLTLIKSGQINNFGLNIGYIYTLVFLKKCYATVSLVPGFGGKHVSYHREDNSTNNRLIVGNGKIHARAGIGYDPGRYFVGTMGIFDYFFAGGKSDAAFEYNYGKFMVYIGYRFSVIKGERKLLKRLKLVDY